MERIFTLIVKTILQALGSGKKPKPQPEPEEKAPCCPIPEPEPEEKKVTHQKRYLWLLDNGHGDSTPGKRSPSLMMGVNCLSMSSTVLLWQGLRVDLMR